MVGGGEGGIAGAGRGSDSVADEGKGASEGWRVALDFGHLFDALEVRGELAVCEAGVWFGGGSGSELRGSSEYRGSGRDGVLFCVGGVGEEGEVESAVEADLREGGAVLRGGGV